MRDTKEARRTSANTRQAEVRAHEELASAAKLLDLPHKGRLVGHVLHATCRCLYIPLSRQQTVLLTKRSESIHPEPRCIGIVGYWHVDLDVVRGTPALELRLDLDHILNPAPLMMLDLHHTHSQ